MSKSLVILGAQVDTEPKSSLVLRHNGFEIAEILDGELQMALSKRDDLCVSKRAHFYLVARVHYEQLPGLSGGDWPFVLTVIF